MAQNFITNYLPDPVKYTNNSAVDQFLNHFRPPPKISKRKRRENVIDFDNNAEFDFRTLFEEYMTKLGFSQGEKTSYLAEVKLLKNWVTLSPRMLALVIAVYSNNPNITTEDIGMELLVPFLKKGIDIAIPTNLEKQRVLLVNFVRYFKVYAGFKYDRSKLGARPRAPQQSDI